MLKGKQGRFRQNLLGKRVDYSGRSVIVVGPDLKLYQCGVPKEMAIELFRPFIMQKLKNDGLTNNIKAARRMVDRAEPEVWDALDVVIKEHPVLLNRAPTLHRLGIQAFEPVLVEGRALKLHPLVCTAYNADFDGDQMAIHLPLSNEAQAEARILMLSANNLLHPKDGKPVTVPTQDMILGSYYLTIVRENEPGAGRAFSSASEALMAYSDGQVGIHAPIKVLRAHAKHNVKKLVETTVGRIFFNEPIPQDLGFVPRNTPEEELEFEISFPVGKKQLEKIISACIEKRGFTESAIVLDKIKELGFKFSTRGAITISMSDMTIPEEKAELIKTSEKIVVQIENAFKDGLLTDDERYDLVTKEWKTTEEKVTDAVKAKLSVDNPIYMMSDSGARGSMNQIRQLIGMRGLMANTAGKTIEIPVKANFREGLTVLEYFISSRGARKGLADTALRTADSGYLTRRLVDVAQDIIIKSHDCGTHNGTYAREERDSNGKVVRSFGASIHGRFAVEDIVSPKTGELLFSNNKLLNERDAELLEENGITEVLIRTVMDCEAKSGVCAKCYGQNLATGDVITAGEAVGIIAAQSIGEPGTQLTMRTFHTGGVAGDDITQGLPRVVELFEARSPKKTAIMAEISGTIEIAPTPRKTIASITITNEETGDIRAYTTPYNTIANILAPDGKTRLIQTGDRVEKGAKLTTGTFAPVSILKILGKEAAQNYIISEVQKMYREQSVDINDKHIEVIVRQMMRFLTVSEGGDTGLLPGQDISFYAFNEANAKLRERISAGEKNRFGEELREAEGERRMLGITKASLSADSFLSSASFQETTRMLTDAAVKGKVDYLVGLKENVIVGKLMPAGSGLAAYRGSELEFGDDYTSDADEQFDVDLSALKEKYNA
jgi:DNA-directed RNA polymerase subunit beta'